MVLLQMIALFGNSTFDLIPRSRFSLFSYRVDVFNAESMQLLEMAGVDFKAHATKGIEPRRFGELITMSGFILSPSITWITFHGIYDFAYFVHILMGSDLPASYEEFDTIRRVYFPHVYDVKALCMECRELSGGLNRIAQQMNVCIRIVIDI